MSSRECWAGARTSEFYRAGPAASCCKDVGVWFHHLSPRFPIHQVRKAREVATSSNFL